MPYCTQCGKPVGEADRYCAHCGAAQPSSWRNGLGGLNPRSASILCYLPLVGWIVAIIVLASNRFRKERLVRFHAFQGLYLFVTWLLVDWVIGPMSAMVGINPFHPGVAALLKLVVLAAWIFMLVKTAQGETYRLPILGELAERSVAERE